MCLGGTVRERLPYAYLDEQKNDYGADWIKVYGTDRYSFLPDGTEVSVADDCC